jgi:tRNA uridine 5-carboxymethylaminomethyl modification enzyme
MERFMEGQVPEELTAALTARERRTVANRLRYGGYIERQERDRERLRREESRRIPAGFDYATVGGLSREVTEKLSRTRPETLAEAGRIPGITPAALMILNVALERRASGKSRPERTISDRPA